MFVKTKKQLKKFLQMAFLPLLFLPMASDPNNKFDAMVRVVVSFMLTMVYSKRQCLCTMSATTIEIQSIWLFWRIQLLHLSWWFGFQTTRGVA